MMSAEFCSLVAVPRPQSCQRHYLVPAVQLSRLSRENVVCRAELLRRSPDLSGMAQVAAAEQGAANILQAECAKTLKVLCLKKLCAENASDEARFQDSLRTVPADAVTASRLYMTIRGVNLDLYASVSLESQTVFCAFGSSRAQAEMQLPRHQRSSEIRRQRYQLRSELLCERPRCLLGLRTPRRTQEIRECPLAVACCACRRILGVCGGRQWDSAHV